MIPPTRYHAAIDTARQTRLAAGIALAREQIATQERIGRASDDPSGTATLSVLARRSLDATGFSANAERARAIAASADAVLADVQGSLGQAIETLSGALNASASADDRRIAATVLEALAEDLDGFAASTDTDGAPLFPAGPVTAIPVDDDDHVRPSLRASELFVEPGSGIGVAATLRAAAGHLRANDTTLARAGFDAVTAAGHHVAEQRGRVGIVASRIDAAIERLSQRETRIAEQRETVNGVDLAATISRLQRDQLTLDAAQALFARLNQSTLFDLLR